MSQNGYGRERGGERGREGERGKGGDGEKGVSGGVVQRGRGGEWEGEEKGREKGNAEGEGEEIITTGAARAQAKESLETLLGKHLPPGGQSAVWRQLALALMCADLWHGTWSPSAVLSAGALPAAVRWELLRLPSELLFCGKALPLSDVDLWRAAAGTLLEACPDVFAQLLGEGCGGDGLQVLAAWLRGARMSFEWLAGFDEAAPLRGLAPHVGRLCDAGLAAPGDACEVAQQLARWRRCDAELMPLLQPLLRCLFAGSAGHDVLLPLLADLAADRWPRAAVAEVELDWRAVARQAVASLRAALAAGVERAGDEAEAALAIWQVFAETVRDGTREWSDEADYGGPHSEWYAARELVQRAEALPELFGLLGRELLEGLRVSAPLASEELRALRKVRATAQAALASWAGLIGQSPAWREALWSPLQNVGRQVAAATRAGGALTEQQAREAEVVLWFSGTLAASWHEDEGAAPVSSAVLELGFIDTAPEPWRALLWSAGCTLASTATGALCPQLVEWMIERSPYAAGVPVLLEFTELPFAQALEVACRRLPGAGGAAHVKAAEHIAGLALSDAGVLHEHSSRARAVLLRSMAHVMGHEAAMLCQGLSSSVLPALRGAVEGEVAAATAKGPLEQPWHAAQTLAATLAAMLPVSDAAHPPVVDAAHPVVALWREHWQFLEAALLRWPPSAGEQPLASAAEALAAVPAALPVLLPEVLRLLARSAASHRLPELQLKALRQALLTTPCPPLEPNHAAELLAAAICDAAEGLLGDDERAAEVSRSAPTLEALYKLLVSALFQGKASELQGRLRALLLGRWEAIRRSMALLTLALPGCSSDGATEQMLRFALQLVLGEELRQAEHRLRVASLLPSLCGSLCRALVVQEHLASAEGGAVDVAELVYRASEATRKSPHSRPQPPSLQPAPHAVHRAFGCTVIRLKP